MKQRKSEIDALSIFLSLLKMSRFPFLPLLETTSPFPVSTGVAIGNRPPSYFVIHVVRSRGTEACL